MSLIASLGGPKTTEDERKKESALEGVIEGIFQLDFRCQMALREVPDLKGRGVEEIEKVRRGEVRN